MGQIQYDWCPCIIGKFGHRGRHREDVKTRGEEMAMWRVVHQDAKDCQQTPEAGSKEGSYPRALKEHDPGDTLILDF